MSKAPCKGPNEDHILPMVADLIIWFQVAATLIARIDTGNKFFLKIKMNLKIAMLDSVAELIG